MNDTQFSRAEQYIAGGVNSPVRAFKAVGGEPIFFARGRGAWLFDEHGKQYIDYVGSWGPMILGHAHPQVVEKTQGRIACGLSFGAPTEIETELAARIIALMPSIEKIRMVNSGTEAAMSAIRLARGFTGRDAIIKFEGCYHGHVDSLLVKAGSGALTLGVPTSPGIPADLARHTITLDYNDPQQLQDAFARRGDAIAAVIVEPVAGNMNCVPASAEFLQALRSSCDEHGSVLIFDEVMSGFRVALGGAQAVYGIRPDLTILGKIIGGGLPVGAFGGRGDIMAQLAPNGPVYQAGTLSGNPVAMTAGLATLELLADDGFFSTLSAKTERLLAGLRRAAAAHEIPFSTNAMGGMFGLFFSEDENISRFAQVMCVDAKRFAAFFRAMLRGGVYLAPSAYEAGFISAAHDDQVIAATLAAAEAAFAML